MKTKRALTKPQVTSFVGRMTTLTCANVEGKDTQNTFRKGRVLKSNAAHNWLVTLASSERKMSTRSTLLLHLVGCFNFRPYKDSRILRIEHQPHDIADFSKKQVRQVGQTIWTQTPVSKN